MHHLHENRGNFTRNFFHSAFTPCSKCTSEIKIEGFSTFHVRTRSSSGTPGQNGLIYTDTGYDSLVTLRWHSMGPLNTINKIVSSQLKEVTASWNPLYIDPFDNGAGVCEGTDPAREKYKFEFKANPHIHVYSNPYYM